MSLPSSCKEGHARSRSLDPGGWPGEGCLGRVIYEGRAEVALSTIGRLREWCRSHVIYEGRAEAALSTTYVMYWCRWPSAGVAAIDTGNMKDDETPSVKKQKGSNGYPKGVSETGRKTIRFQARVGYKPSPDGKTVQRSAGTFDTPEEAALQVAAYEAKLAEGIDPWNGEQVRSQHGRGQVRSQLPLSNVPSLIQGSRLQAPRSKPKASRRKDDSSASESDEHGPDGDEVAAAGKEPPPQYTVMPSSINDVRCAPMSAFLLQDPAPWIALQSMDGSGELSY